MRRHADRRDDVFGQHAAQRLEQRHALDLGDRFDQPFQEGVDRMRRQRLRIVALKLRGDLGMGYERARFDDSRLATLGALTLDGTVQWSPQRGTDLRLGLATELEPSTAAGQSGYVSYEATSELTHELRENLVARLSAAYNEVVSIAAERLLPDAPPNVEWLIIALQHATDAILGKPGAKLLLGTVMVV